MVGVAVKVTDAPEQIDVDEAFTDTDGVTDAFTVMVLDEVAIQPNASLTSRVTIKFPDVA